jgi:hypothetical protein
VAGQPPRAHILGFAHGQPDTVEGPYIRCMLHLARSQRRVMTSR